MEQVALLVEDMEGVFWELARQVLEQEFLEPVLGEALEQEVKEVVTKQEEQGDFKQEVLEAHLPESSHPLAG